MPKWVDRLIAKAVWREVEKKMPVFLMEWVKRIFPKNLAGVLGVAQQLVVLVKELVIVAIRIAAIVVPGKLPENLIVKVQVISTGIENAIHRIKGIMLE